LTPPFAPFTENNNLYHIVTHWKELAGIRFRTKQRHGLHSLRHYVLFLTMSRDLDSICVEPEIAGHSV
jgi:hypothetical protein